MHLLPVGVICQGVYTKLPFQPFWQRELVGIEDLQVFYISFNPVAFRIGS